MTGCLENGVTEHIFLYFMGQAPPKAATTSCSRGVGKRTCHPSSGISWLSNLSHVVFSKIWDDVNWKFRAYILIIHHPFDHSYTYIYIYIFKIQEPTWTWGHPSWDHRLDLTQNILAPLVWGGTKKRILSSKRPTNRLFDVYLKMWCLKIYLTITPVITCKLHLSTHSCIH